ncbi:MAG: proline dehydrogenase family protein [Flavobacteriales bacterium]
MVSFTDTKTAFEYKSNKALKKAQRLFTLIGMPRLSKLGMKLANLGLKLHLPISGLIKSTVFDQFCGGTDIEDSQKTMETLAQYGVHSLLDYSVEGKANEADFNACASAILETIKLAKDQNHIPFAVFKVTGLIRFELLEKKNTKQTLSKAEKIEYNTGYKRVDKLCKKAFNLNVPIMIDAEESWIQDAIDDIVEDCMKKYNKVSVIVYNTVQLYRHDRLDYLKSLHKRSQEEGFYVGLKLVRGAYMEKERNRAKENDYLSPIQPDKASTDRDYDLALRYCLAHHSGISICAGTHNETSSLLLTTLMKEAKIDKQHVGFYFAQLLGMSDNISFNLAKHGYRVVKYVPFGPVKDVMPYLIRRAEENTSIAGQSSRELKLINEEIKRRSLN